MSVALVVAGLGGRLMMKRLLVVGAVVLFLLAMTVSVFADPIHVGGGPRANSVRILIGGGPSLFCDPIHVGGGPCLAFLPIHVGGGPQLTTFSPIHVGGGPRAQ